MDSNTNIGKIRELKDTRMGMSYSDMRATGPLTIDDKEGYDLPWHEIIPIRSSIVPKIGHMVQHEESFTTVVDNGDAPSIQRLYGYRLNPVKVMKNIGMPSTYLDTKQMAASDTEINTSLRNMSITTSTEGSGTDPYMEQCYDVAREKRETGVYME